jgi:hypothetical protein
MGKFSPPWYVWTFYGTNTTVFGLALLSWNQSDLQARLEAEATVIDVVRHEETDEDGVHITYSPIFRFIDSRTGEEFEAESVMAPRVGTFRDNDKNKRSSARANVVFVLGGLGLLLLVLWEYLPHIRWPVSLDQ